MKRISVADEMNGDGPAVGLIPVFKQIYTLPGAERKVSTYYWN